MVQLVIFDIDGTLIDSNDAHATTWQDALSQFGVNISFSEARRLIGMGGDQILKQYFTDAEIEKFGDEVTQCRSDLFHSHYLDKIKPFPQVRDLFERIRDDGLEIALASSAKSEDVERYKQIANIADLVSDATSATDVEHSKPAPDIFEAALDQSSVDDRREAVIVGDTPYDVEAAIKAGISIIGVTSGGWSESVLMNRGCYKVFKDVQDMYINYDDLDVLRA